MEREKRKSATLYRQLCRQLRWDEIDPAHLRQLIALARDEDLKGAGLAGRQSEAGDLSTGILESSGWGKALLVARAEMVVCGLPLVPLILQAYGPDVALETALDEGERVKAGTALGRVLGPPKTLLQAERVLLNFLQMLCGVATHTAAHVAALGDTDTKLLDTRKTTPGFRALEKYAVGCGGGWNHRMGLFDRVMLKDNHLQAGQSAEGEGLERLINKARALNPGMIVEVEVDQPEQITPALKAGADVILLDNFPMEALREAVSLIGDAAFTEASGGVTLENLPEMAGLGLDFISCGGLVHQSRWKDIGLDWEF